MTGRIIEEAQVLLEAENHYTIDIRVKLMTLHLVLDISIIR